MELNKTKLFSILKNSQDYITIILVATLLLDELFEKIFKKHFLVSLADTDFRITIIITLITLFTINVTSKLNEIINNIPKFSNRQIGVKEITTANERIEFRKILNDKKIIQLLTLSGTRTIELGHKDVVVFLNSINKHTKVLILIGNPYSDAIITRYKVDEPHYHETGLEGIKRRIAFLYTASKKYNKNVEIKVFDNYPIYSIIRVDEGIIATTYGYKMRGGEFPKIHANIFGEYGRALLTHLDNTYDSAIDIELWYKTYKEKLIAEMII